MGSYQSGSATNPTTVNFTTAETIQDVSDWYQFVDNDYRGTDSVDAVRLRVMLRSLLTNKPLDAADWDILRDLQKRLGQEFETWKARGRDGQNTAIPVGTGRIGEALALVSPSILARIREAREGAV